MHKLPQSSALQSVELDGKRMRKRGGLRVSKREKAEVCIYGSYAAVFTPNVHVNTAMRALDVKLPIKCSIHTYIGLQEYTYKGLHSHIYSAALSHKIYSAALSHKIKCCIHTYIVLHSLAI